MSSATSEFKWNEAKLAQIQKDITTGLVKLGHDTAYQAQKGAPVDTGALVNSIRTTDIKDNTVYVLAGGTAGGYNVPYARRREYENPKHPNTRFYMKNALKWAQDNLNSYFKDITK